MRRRSRKRGNNAQIRSSVQRGAPPRRWDAVAIRFSSTLSVGKICRPSGTKPKPRWATRYGGRPVIACPSKAAVPPQHGSSPMMAETVVVLPMPLRPSSASTSPAPTDSDTSNSTWLPP